MTIDTIQTDNSNKWTQKTKTLYDILDIDYFYILCILLFLCIDNLFFFIGV